MYSNNQNHGRIHTRTLTMLALMVAMNIVFARVLSISTGFLRFNLSGLPTLLASVLFGPWAGFAVAAVADLVGGVLSGYAVNPIITLGTGIVGFAPGFFWRAMPNRPATLRLVVGVLVGHLIGSTIINSLALHLFYNYAWSVLAMRIPNTLVLCAIEVVVMRVLLANRALMQAIGPR